MGESRGSDDRASASEPGPETGRQRTLGERVERSRPAYRLTNQVSPRGEKARIEANLAALSLLTQLGERTPTTDEQEVLVRFSGWGGLSALFDTRTDTYKHERETLQSLVDESAYKRALQSTANAHYTNPAIARALWTALSALGLEEGARVVEPGCGVGMFIGTAPETIRIIGVEIDPTPATIAARLYPNADIRNESYTDTDLDEAGYFDAAIGNVPFGSFRPYDPVYNPGGHTIHNYFISKALAQVRPGGIVAVLTSRYTMDAKNPGVRRELYARADLLGAVRLPAGTHEAMAGTDVVSDILIFRRREKGEEPQPFDWEYAPLLEIGGNEFPVNEYFHTHTEHVLGGWEETTNQYGPALSVTGNIDALEGQLATTLATITSQARAAGLVFTPRRDAYEGEIALRPVDQQKLGRITKTEAGFERYTVNGNTPVRIAKNATEQLTALLDLRDQTRALVEFESQTQENPPTLTQARNRLKTAYEEYVARFGPLNSQRERWYTDKKTGEEKLSWIDVPAVRVFRSDPDAALTMAIEIFDKDTRMARPAGILERRQIGITFKPLGADTIEDGLAICMVEKGRVDTEYIGYLTGQTSEEVMAGLREHTFFDPETNELMERTAYLSGNIHTKLVDAETALETDARMSENIAALKAALPEPLTLSDIEISPGAPWISVKDHHDFYSQVVMGWHQQRVGQVGYNPVTGAWKAVQDGYQPSPTARRIWNTERRSGTQIFEALLNHSPITVKSKTIDGEEFIDRAETAAVAQKMEDMATAFTDWVWADGERAARLEARYNVMFNSFVPRDYTGAGEALKLPGLAKDITPYSHQRSGVARMIYQESVGLFHQVGAGKTKTMIMGAMELKRLGLIHKPVIAVPANVLYQFASEFQQTYPAARVLTATPDDLTKSGRREFVAKVATNDWDAVVMTHEQFKALGCSNKTQAEYIEARIDELEEAIKASEVAARNIYRIWEQTKDNRYSGVGGEESAIPGALQLVFCDYDTPKDGWNTYDALRSELYGLGLPEGSVRFIHEAKNNPEKEELFRDCREGRVAVLIGSTQKMGTGTNVQKRCIATHHLDVPWRPTDITQRDGRMVRQGNENPEVYNFRYVVTGSFAAYMWQTNERKARSIAQIMTNKSGTRSVEDVSPEEMEAGRAKAIATGNPLLLEKCEVDATLQKYKALHSSWQRTRNRAIDDTRTLGLRIRASEQTIATLEHLQQYIRDTSGDRFSIRIENGTYTERAAAAQALSRAVSARISPYTIENVRRTGGTYSVPQGVRIELGGIELDIARVEAESRMGVVSDVAIVFMPTELKDVRYGPRASIPLSILQRGQSGLIQRLENLVASLPQRLEEEKENLEFLREEAQSAQELSTKEFPHEAEYAAVRTRSKEITLALEDQGDTKAHREQEARFREGIKHEGHEGFFEGLATWPRIPLPPKPTPIDAIENWQTLPAVARYESREYMWEVLGIVAGSQNGQALTRLTSNAQTHLFVADLVELEAMSDPLTHAPGTVAQPLVHRTPLDEGQREGETLAATDNHSEQSALSDVGEVTSGVADHVDDEQPAAAMRPSIPTLYDGVERTALTEAAPGVFIAKYGESVVTFLDEARNQQVGVPYQRLFPEPGDPVLFAYPDLDIAQTGNVAGSGQVARAILLGSRQDSAYLDGYAPTWRTAIDEPDVPDVRELETADSAEESADLSIPVRYVPPIYRGETPEHVEVLAPGIETATYESAGTIVFLDPEVDALLPSRYRASLFAYPGSETSAAYREDKPREARLRGSAQLVRALLLGNREDARYCHAVDPTWNDDASEVRAQYKAYCAANYERQASSPVFTAVSRAVNAARTIGAREAADPREHGDALM
ncbi:hypothetical protein PWJ87_03200 [Actinotignum sanguinis]|uniref:helicase-related protein n=1 Tax=Actinotignum sanguinis TaxID=1445614 RepID=UPI00237D8063|nr:helicase-related protein [Actinotignum sanguinis]MDE1576990.1 hypothetical protein [Actinotignum sanguinis]